MMANNNLLDISIIIVSKNEQKRIGSCLDALGPYSEYFLGGVWVVDSQSKDGTQLIAAQKGATVIDYIWNGRYPKKRQWCLEYLELKTEWVLFVDVDEHITEALVDELKALELSNEAVAGYFIKGQYEWHGKVLKYGLQNNKIALLHKRRMKFPIVQDLDIAGMGEIEGHYQPALADGYEYCKIGQLHMSMLHKIDKGWTARHRRYAIWEAGMNKAKVWPKDPISSRNKVKNLFRSLYFLRPFAAFLHSYIYKLGFMDGSAGFDFACSRSRYYQMISDASKDLDSIA